MNLIRTPLRLCVALVSAAVSSTSNAADWPNWRGPDHNGISSETGWRANWPADGPTRLWKTSVGTGFSSMSVSQGRLYTMGNQNDTDTVFCLDAESGKLIWQHSYACPTDARMFEGGPTATPAADENRVFTFSRNGALFCFDAATGKVLWSKNLVDATGAEPPTWGFASSPLIQGNSLFLNVGASGIAVDKTTGSILWRSGAGPPGYATPVPCTLSGTPAVILLARAQLVAVAAKTGHPLWRFPWETDYDINVADPILAGDDVFVSSGYDHGAARLRIQSGRVDVVWQNSSLRNVVNSSVLLDGCLYGIDGQAGHSETLKCLDFPTGNVHWEYKGLGSGALIAADKKLIVLSDQGELVVATASPEAFGPISRAQVLGGKCWTTPVLANGRVYCRNARGELVCLDVKGKS
jgi:outer membrane protein assembly factor BamB